MCAWTWTNYWEHHGLNLTFDRSVFDYFFTCNPNPNRACCMLVTRMLVTANNQLASNQHAMEWDPHTHVGYSSSHVGYSHVGYSHVGYSHVGYLPHVGYMPQRYEITNVRSPAGWLLLHNSVITNMRATKLQGAGWLSRMLVISCWLLHLARLVCHRYTPVHSGMHVGVAMGYRIQGAGCRCKAS